MVTFDSGAGATGWLISSYIMAIHISGKYGGKKNDFCINLAILT